MPTRRQFLVEAAAITGAAAWTRAVSGQAGATTFDFVIIGAGAAGCVLANRLSADPKTRVLLVEAGGPDTNSLIPAIGQWTSLLNSEVDWAYKTEPDPGLGGRQLLWPRGKTYGGSSAISAAAYVRGHRSCFDAWASAAGSSWGPDAVRPILNGLEDNSRGAADHRGAGGPLAVSDTTDPHAGHAMFLEAARVHGFEASPTFDFNSDRQEGGAGFYQKHLKNGRRQSAAAAFLAPVLNRPNLVVWPNSLVTHLTFEGRRAAGCSIVRDRRVDVRATREIVLAGGVIETPKLLMLSGIGPAAVLKSAGIPVVADRSGVGQNLHDHPKVSPRWQARTPLAGSTVSAGLFVRSNRARSGSGNPPDLQFYVGRGLSAPDPFVTLTVALSQPRSRGSLKIRSSDPTAAPIIEPGYFKDPSDLEALLDGLKLARELAAWPGYASIRGDAVDPPNAATDGNLRAFIRRTADTIFHPVGTCRMGKAGDSVVDPELRVRGVTGIRVADASIMPVVVNCQTLAACLLIGERAARLMLG